jgi:hypothetical protein
LLGVAGTYAVQIAFQDAKYFVMLRCCAPVAGKFAASRRKF